MEEKAHKVIIHKNGGVTDQYGITNVICKKIESHILVWQENITIIDISLGNIKTFDGEVKLPVNLVQLNLSRNKFDEVPGIVINLEKLKVLNLSHNTIKHFDDYPKFCHTLEHLNMSFNHLEGPPCWIWTEKPQKLIQVNLSNNANITKSFDNGYFEELLQYSSLVTEISLENCRLNKFIDLLSTFPKAISLCLGSEEYIHSANSLIEIPCKGLDKCRNLKRLNVGNTHVYTISPSIEIYRDLVEINLAQNDINGIPNEFCNLENLETCILSANKILYLPDDFCKLKKLVRLYLDSNELCMLPDKMCELSNLKTLDLYDNHLNEVLGNFGNLEELDLAQNYFEEPEDTEYLEKKEKLRLVHETRYSGRKNIIIHSDDYSENESEDEDDEELYEIFNNGKKLEDPPLTTVPPISPEDWDSDAYWVPFHQNPVPSAPSPWLCFVKQKMKEGNFCPMDAHPVSISEKVRYERMCNPQVNNELDGQFDDYSGDDT